MAQVETVEVQILDKGIHCAGCEARIQSILARVPGIQEAKANYKTQKVRLIMDLESVSIQQVNDKLENLGYRTA